MSSEIVDREALRTNVQSLAAKLESGESDGVVRPWLSAVLENDVHSSASFVQYGTPFRFESDEAVERGGGDRAPSPMRYLLASMTFCFQGWCAKTWSVHGQQLNRAAVDVRTLLDMRGEHGVAGESAHPPWFVLDADIGSDAEDGIAVDLLRQAKERCPITSLVSAASPVYLMLKHNGQQVLDERPEALQNEHRQEQKR